MKCPYCIKICSKCKRILVAYSGNFAKKKGGKYGLISCCKECLSKRNKECYKNNKEYYKEYYKNNKEQIKEYKKEYYENNKEYYKEYRENNKEQIKKHNKKYYKNNKEQIKEHNKKYYKNNKEYYGEYYKEWKKNNPDKTFNDSIKRRQLEENQGNGITKEQWLEMMNFFDWKCAYSGEQLNKNNRSIDHIIALTKNGEHEIWNCIPMLKKYNSSKNTKNMLEWYKEQKYYSEEKLEKIYQWIEYAKNKYKDIE